MKRRRTNTQLPPSSLSSMARTTITNGTGCRARCPCRRPNFSSTNNNNNKKNRIAHSWARRRRRRALCVMDFDANGIGFWWMEERQRQCINYQLILSNVSAVRLRTQHSGLIVSFVPFRVHSLVCNVYAYLRKQPFQSTLSSASN